MSTVFSDFFFDYDKEDTAGVTDQQRMLTPHRHLILPLSIWKSVLLCFEFMFRFMDFLRWFTVCDCHYFVYISHKTILFSFLNFKTHTLFYWFFFVHHSLYYAIINRKTTLFNISTKYLLITIPFWAVWCPKTRYLSTPKCSLLLRKWAIY